jgi:hypothetical protein
MCKSRFAIITLLLAITLLLSACSTISPLSGSGNIITQEKAFRDFNSIDISNGFEVEITQADSYRVTIIADDNVFDNLEVVHEDDVLRMFLSPAFSYVTATKKVIITMPEIHSLKMSVGTKGSISEFKSSNDFQLDLSTGSQLTGIMNIGNADFKLSTGSSVKLDGSANNLVFDASTGSSGDLENFVTSNTDIKLSSGSKATINTTGELKADLSGGSSLYYLGDPVISKVTSSRGCSIQSK